MPELDDKYCTLPCLYNPPITDPNGILSHLENERIFRLSFSDGNSKITITENCDQFFEKSLNKKAFKQLIKELTDIYNKME